MKKKYLVTLNASDDVQQIANSGCELISEYPDSRLVACTPDQYVQLIDAGLEIEDLEPVFGFASALAVERALTSAGPPIQLDNDRKAFYVAKCVGPVKGDWIEELKHLGGEIQNTLPGDQIVIGMMPGSTPEFEQLEWVENLSPYAPALKVASSLRRSESTIGLGATELAATPNAEEPDAAIQIEVNVFKGEKCSRIAEQIKTAGGSIISQTKNKVVAIVPRRMIVELANEQSVQSILPFMFAHLHNDQASQIMAVPEDRILNGQPLRGGSEVIAVADSGVDTGDVATIHADFAGRVVNIDSLPNSIDAQTLATYSHSNSNDGAADTNSGHGTHVAGSVLGNGTAATDVNDNAAPEMDPVPVPSGIAPDASLFFQAVEQEVNWKTAQELIAEGTPVPFNWPPKEVGLYGLPNDLADLFQPAYSAGARVHTNSWGAPIDGVYSENSAAVDEFMWNHRDMLILYSAGNAGVDQNTDGLIDQDSIGSPGTAKNCLTVGASENNRPTTSVPEPGINANWSDLQRWTTLTAAGHVSDEPEGMAAFSSRGPTNDGRIKPDVVAPGTNVLSVRSTQTGADPLWGDLSAADRLAGLYCWSGGTSMSTPLVAGFAALVRQHLIRDREHFQANVSPSGALIKAFIVNGAVPISGQFPNEVPSGPNTVSGFGRANFDEAFAANGSLTTFIDDPDLAVQTGEIRRFEFEAVDDSRPINITLVWTDAPSQANVGGLVNKLLLQIRQPDGTIIDSGVDSIANTVNNVQRITIQPIEGTYQLRVRGVNVVEQSPGAAAPDTNPRQDFAVAASNIELQP